MKINFMCLCLTFCAFFGNKAHSAIDNYQCSITEELFLEDTGELKRPPNPDFIGQRFSVDRQSGKILSPDSALWQINGYKIMHLANGDANYAFTVISADSSGSFSSVLRINEFNDQKRKPFTLLSGSQIFSGLCE